MLKQHLATCLLASALVGGPALAQQTQPGQPPAQQQPDATRPAQPGAAQQQSQQQQPGMTGGQTAGPVRPLAGPGPNQMLSSEFRGTAVYGANNEKIGNVDDLLMDQKGQVVAAIVGVGGFLGIGEKNVAIPFEAFEIVAEAPATGTATTTRPRATTGGTIDPDRVVLRGMTRADLEAAPTFRKDGTAAAGTATGTGTTGATGGPAGSSPPPARPTAPAR